MSDTKSIPKTVADKTATKVKATADEVTKSVVDKASTKVNSTVDKVLDKVKKSVKPKS